MQTAQAARLSARCIGHKTRQGFHKVVMDPPSGPLIHSSGIWPREPGTKTVQERRGVERENTVGDRGLRTVGPLYTAMKTRRIFYLHCNPVSVYDAEPGIRVVRVTRREAGPHPLCRMRLQVLDKVQGGGGVSEGQTRRRGLLEVETPAVTVATGAVSSMLGRLGRCQSTSGRS